MHLNFCESIFSYEREMCPSSEKVEWNKFLELPVDIILLGKSVYICYRSTNTRTDYLKVDMYSPICLEFLWSVFSVSIGYLSVTLA